MKKRWIEMLIAALIIAGGSVAFVVSIFVYLAKSTPAIHPSAAKVGSVVGTAPPPRWTAAVEKSRATVRANVLSQNVPGISVAVGIGGDMVWTEGFGVADIATRAPVSPATRFRIGHVSKALTSAAVGWLLEHGQLGLDRDIQEYVPAYPKKSWPVTVRQLMGHTAGVIHYRDTEWGDKPSTHCDRAGDGVATFAKDALLFEPETKYQYSTYGWVLVSAAIERVSGQSFFDAMRTRVFDPLHMSSTTPDAPKTPLPDRATSYFINNFGRAESTAVDYSCFAGGGAFLSTPSDLVRFGVAMTSGTLLQRDTVAKLQTRQTLRDGQMTQYGLGWMLESIKLNGQPEAELLAGHASRTLEGASTSFLTFPERGLVVAVSSNMSFVDMRSIALAIAQAFVENGH